jgi:[NiFe] hydrogenase assembly HybE family chaperone
MSTYAGPLPDDPGHQSAEARLEAVFNRIAATRMQGLGVLNPALTVEAVGFRPWGGNQVGILVTPWFMSLICLPGPDAAWANAGSGATRKLELPSGTYAFLTAREAELGPYLTASLFSPMFDFADMERARRVAHVALEELFSPPAPEAPSSAAPGLAAKLGRPLSRRRFLGSCLGQTDRP